MLSAEDFKEDKEFNVFYFPFYWKGQQQADSAMSARNEVVKFQPEIWETCSESNQLN